MIGFARTTRSGKTAFFESMRIEARASGVVLVARPSGQNEAEFPLVKSDGEKTATFENPEHDFPKRIVYRRDGEKLVARIEGGGAPTEWKYERGVIALH